MSLSSFARARYYVHVLRRQWKWQTRCRLRVWPRRCERLHSSAPSRATIRLQMGSAPRDALGKKTPTTMQHGMTCCAMLCHFTSPLALGPQHRMCVVYFHWHANGKHSFATSCAVPSSISVSHSVQDPMPCRAAPLQHSARAPSAAAPLRPPSPSPSRGPASPGLRASARARAGHCPEGLFDAPPGVL